MTVGTGERRIIFRQLESVGGELAGGRVGRWQGRDELRLTLGHFCHQRARLAMTCGGVVDEFLWDQVVMFRFGLEYCGNPNGIGLGTRIRLDFANEVCGDCDLDVVAEIGFVPVVTVDAIEPALSAVEWWLRDRWHCRGDRPPWRRGDVR